MYTFSKIVLLVWIPFILAKPPVDSVEEPDTQPGCPKNVKMGVFYETATERTADKNNWLCEETFLRKLRICTDVFQTRVKYAFETTLKIVRDKPVVEECEKRNVTFYKTANEDEKIVVNFRMFKCPITKLDIEFPPMKATPALYDFYLAKGKFNATLTLLLDSKTEDNICVEDLLFVYDIGQEQRPSPA